MSNGGNGNYIGGEKAKTIALQAASITSSQAKQLRCYLEHDDGHWEYNVEFCSGTVEYEYEIDAFTGKILSQDVDSIYD